MNTPATEIAPPPAFEPPPPNPAWKGSPRRIALALLCLLALALPTTFAYLTLKLHASHETTLSTAASRKLALALTSHFDRTVESVETFLGGFSAGFASLTPDEIFDYLQGLKPPQGVIQISFIDASGQFIASSLAAPGKMMDLSDREHIKVHLKGEPWQNDIFLSKPVKGRISGTWSIQFSKALKRIDGKLVGVLVASYEISSFISFYDSLRPDGRGVVALIGNDGIIRAVAPGSDQFDGQPASRLFENLPAPDTLSEGIYSGGEPDGIRRSGYYVHSSRYPFLVLVATDDAFTAAQSSGFRLAVMGLSVALGLTLLALAAFGLRHWQLQSAFREQELQAIARHREAKVLQAISRVPGITVLHIENGRTTQIGREEAGELPRMIRERVATPQFLARVKDGDSSVSLEHFSQEGAEFEVEVVVARLEERDEREPRGVNGKMPTAVVFALDETAKRMEQNKLYQMSKMASLGELVTGLAHEINQPLGVIRLAAGNALAGLRKGPPGQHTTEKLERIIRQVARMKAIIDHMRIFGRHSTPTVEPSSALAAIAGTVQVLGTDMRLGAIELSTDTSVEDIEVPCGQEQLEQVLINLVLNARDAIGARRESEADVAGRIDIALAPAVIDGRRHASVTVRDNGGGIPTEVIEKIFQPFFTTKAPGQGTGLGLSVSFGIIREYGGAISATNVGDGAQFTILLPAVEPGAPAADAPDPPLAAGLL
ncbi:hypothetical protein KHC23_21860 [Ancylobacter dichloromethanicus]|uniref:ATP-binding protein n=1 Tax=Ancylobacter dichloromethanicus TaxID=518825 RepID=UPI001BCECD2C|nr:ATP-binding protein [Ancylobacter dichloromethanicus]MBS7556281.1 hypothetical protein [Ancylobacter dichloromethanicus]